MTQPKKSTQPKARKLVTRKGLFGRYWMVYLPDHFEADWNGYVFEHRMVAEKALGKQLPEGCHVHHVDGNSENNEPSNLVICQDAEYHYLLHARAEALARTGNADSTRCERCGWWVVPNKPHGCKVMNMRQQMKRKRSKRMWSELMDDFYKKRGRGVAITIGANRFGVESEK